MRGKKSVVILIFLILVLLPGAAAQEVRTGGTVVIPKGTTVHGLTATGGTVNVQGTVDGDLLVFGGDIVIDGTVTGNTNVFGGSIVMNGNLQGNTTAIGGSVSLGKNGLIGKTLSVAAGEVVLNGSITHDARVDAEQLRVGPTARIGGDLIHSATSLHLAKNASIAGAIKSVDHVNVTGNVPLPGQVPVWILSLYGFVVDLLLGALLLFFFPGVSAEIAIAGQRKPLTAVLIGLATVILTPMLLVLLMFTIIGIPFALLGLFLFIIALWGASIYGSFTIGTAIMDRLNRQNKWFALGTGLAVVFLLGAIPFVGGLIHVCVLIFGLGAIIKSLH